MGMLLYMEELKRNEKAKKVEQQKEEPVAEPVEAKNEEPVKRGRPARKQGK